MPRSVRRRRNGNAVMAFDIAPLIDVVFILLIFFLVSTSFVRDSGIDVTRPEATQSHELESDSLRIHITAGGQAFTDDGQPADLKEVAQRVREFVAQREDGTVVLIADAELPVGALGQFLDTVMLAGGRVALATTNVRLTPLER